ncbi:hypothetical protein BH09ACT7_BH09ACT7_08310 [soil metagenome]
MDDAVARRIACPGCDGRRRWGFSPSVPNFARTHLSAVVWPIVVVGTVFSPSLSPTSLTTTMVWVRLWASTPTIKPMTGDLPDAQSGAIGVVWGIEDCRPLTARLERELLAVGERLVRVPPHLMSRSRTSSRELGKSDPIDALACARAVLREPDLPVASHDAVSMELKLLVDRREDLVGQRGCDSEPTVVAGTRARSLVCQASELEHQKDTGNHGGVVDGLQRVDS